MALRCCGRTSRRRRSEGDLHWPSQRPAMRTWRREARGEVANDGHQVSPAFVCVETRLSRYLASTHTAGGNLTQGSSGRRQAGRLAAADTVPPGVDSETNAGG